MDKDFEMEPLTNIAKIYDDICSIQSEVKAEQHHAIDTKAPLSFMTSLYEIEDDLNKVLLKMTAQKLL
jgi:hypothetical protein